MWGGLGSAATCADVTDPPGHVHAGQPVKTDVPSIYLPSRPHKDVYETTTLSIVIFTTVICGGATEPLLSMMGMKRQEPAGGRAGDRSDNDGDGDDAYEMMAIAADAEPPSPFIHRRLSRQFTHGVHGIWKDIDNRYMKPLFGGRPGPPSDDGGGDEREAMSDIAVEMH